MQELSEVVMTLALDWNPRWAVIMLVNSFARSTLDISNAPDVTVERLPSPAKPRTGATRVSTKCSSKPTRSVMTH